MWKIQGLDLTNSFWNNAHERVRRAESSQSCSHLISWVGGSVVKILLLVYFVVVQSLSCVQLFTTPWTAARQASLSFTISRGLLKLMSIELVMPSSRLIFCRPLLLLPSVFPSIRVFSKESALYIRWPEYWSFSLGVRPCDMVTCQAVSCLASQFP